VHPFHHRRILITRSRHQASDLADQLEALGAIPILIPTIEIVPPESYAPLDAALAKLETFDWLLFTSANAVDVFQQRRVRSQRPGKIAVIGPATARAVEGIGLAVDLMPPQYIAESMTVALTPFAPNSRMLLIRAEQARDHLPEALAAAGARVTIATAYRNRTPSGSVSALVSLFSDPAGYPEAITFTSASTVRNLFSLLDGAGLTLPPDITLASIGPITSETLREFGYRPTVEADAPSIGALIEALVKRFGRIG
jgi:uroporphyrinogen-III synthase